MLFRNAKDGQRYFVRPGSSSSPSASINLFAEICNVVGLLTSEQPSHFVVRIEYLFDWNSKIVRSKKVRVAPNVLTIQDDRVTLNEVAAETVKRSLRPEAYTFHVTFEDAECSFDCLNSHDLLVEVYCTSPSASTRLELAAEEIGWRYNGIATLRGLYPRPTFEPR